MLDLNNLKIGLLAPTKGGKTTLLATTLQEVSTMLRGNKQGVTFCATDKKTCDAIQDKIAEYCAVFALEDPFAVPVMPGDVDISDYKFSLNVPTDHEDTVRLRLWFKDFPGGWIGQEQITGEILPFLNEASAIIVPIASDFVMALSDSHKKGDPVLIARNVAARKSLQTADILQILSDWVKRKVANGERPYIAFAPIRCEAYFNDNGGRCDKSEKLFSAIQEFFVKPLYTNLGSEEKDRIQIEIHAVDTYGVVELVETNVIDGQLESRFRRRQNPNVTPTAFASKGAFALLTRLLNYLMGECANGLGIQQNELEDAIANRNVLQRLFFSIFKGTDTKKRELSKTMSEKTELLECMTMFKRIAPPDPYRQRIISNNGETMIPLKGE